MHCNVVILPYDTCIPCPSVPQTLKRICVKPLEHKTFDICENSRDDCKYSSSLRHYLPSAFMTVVLTLDKRTSVAALPGGQNWLCHLCYNIAAKPETTTTSIYRVLGSCPIYQLKRDWRIQFFCYHKGHRVLLVCDKMDAQCLSAMHWASVMSYTSVPDRLFIASWSVGAQQNWLKELLTVSDYAVTPKAWPWPASTLANSLQNLWGDMDLQGSKRNPHVHASKVCKVLAAKQGCASCDKLHLIATEPGLHLKANRVRQTPLMTRLLESGSKLSEASRTWAT